MPHPTTDSTKQLSFLLVEDDKEDLFIFRKMLGRGPVRPSGLIASQTMADCVLKIMVETPDIIFLDLNLPDAFGLAGLSTVRQVAPETPVIILTGSNEPSLRQNAIDQGANYFFCKDGLDEEAFFSAIDDVLSSRASDPAGA